MSKRWLISFTIVGLAVLAAGLISRRDEAPRAAAADTPLQTTAASAAVPAIPPIAVEVAHPQPARTAEKLVVTGDLAAKVEADVRAEIPGTLAEVLVTDWVPVKKGDLLARMDTRDLDLARKLQLAKIQEADARLQKATVARETMQRDADRMDKLFTEGIISAKEHDDASNDSNQSAADIAMNRASLAAERATLDAIDLKLRKAEIRAPIGGVVAMRRANPGLSVDATSMEDALFKIVDLAHLDLRLNIPMSALAAVKLGQPVSFETDALPGRTFTATIRYLNPTADSSTRSVKAIAEVDNTSGTLRTGLFARATILLGGDHPLLEIPVQAAQLGGNGEKTATVFIAQEKKAVRRTIEIGEVSDTTIQVLSGLKAEDAVITRGAYQLRDGDPIRMSNEK